MKHYLQPNQKEIEKLLEKGDIEQAMVQVAYALINQDATGEHYNFEQWVNTLAGWTLTNNQEKINKFRQRLKDEGYSEPTKEQMDAALKRHTTGGEYKLADWRSKELRSETTKYSVTDTD